ncbi:MAG: alpha/beta hydrolase [Burkholderiaceae bacterium]|nr:alpha/beta hydrolase [Burkholderiaceae bacterium]
MAFARLGGIRIEYFDHGSGPEVVVFVHGFQASAPIWHAVQQRLPAERYRSIAINNRGAGGSDAPPEESDFTIQCFAADVLALLDTLGLDRVVLVGHSMGGATVAQFAVDHPQRVKALVLLDPASPNGRDLSAGEIERLLDERDAARDALLAKGGAGDGLGAHRIELDATQRQQLLADIVAAPRRRLRGSMRSLLQLRLGGRVRKLPMPVLLAAGDADQVIALENMLATWAMYPPGTGLHVWHGIGHSPNVECPQAFVDLLCQFVEKAVPGIR